MQLTDVIPSDSVPMPGPLEAVERTARTYCVVWRGAGDSLWKADVTADHVTAAVQTVCYDQGLSPEQVVGAIDRSTIR